MSGLLNAVVIAAGVLALAAAALGRGLPALAAAAGLLALAAGLHLLLFARPRARARGAVEALARRHRDALARRRLTLRVVDAYGVPDDEAWSREVDRFLDRVVAPRLPRRVAAALDADRDALFARIDGLAAARAAALEDELGASADDPGDFERWCAATLRREGWRTRLTGGSGDQGADVVAERDGLAVVLQCKLYTKPVGNKAVQEAFAARRHYGAAHAAVVTNAGFTRAAVELAGTTGVILLHYSELADLAGRIAAEAPSPARPRRPSASPPAAAAMPPPLVAERD